VEASLLELRLKAKRFQDSVAFLCRTMTDQAECISRICKDDLNDVGRSTQRYAEITKGYIQETAFQKLCEGLELKVFEPINVNLMVLNEIKARAQARDAMRKKKNIKGPSTAANPEFAAITARLFEELAALKQHRYDFIRGLYDGLKTIQRRFFDDCTTALQSREIDVVPKTEVDRTHTNRNTKTITDTSSEKMSSFSPVTSPSPPSIHIPNSANKTPTATAKKEIMIATPAATRFNPLADQIDIDKAPAFSRFKKNGTSSCESQSDDEDECDMQETTTTITQKLSNTWTDGARKNVTNTNIRQQDASRRAFEDEDDEEFDTV
jgi:hypothetical protein